MRRRGATGGTRTNAGTLPTGRTLLRRSNGVGGATSRLSPVGGGVKRGVDRVERRRTKGISKPFATNTNRRVVEQSPRRFRTVNLREGNFQTFCSYDKE